jgi:choline dehydrogenase-like flavoprotein
MSRTVHDASALERDLALSCDVAVIGTGAGGGTAAEILAQAGLRVVMLEEGAYRTARDFTLRESDASTELYFDGASRTTKDGTMTILQGRTVGGSTTVNWTASFRTPVQVLRHWSEAHGVRGVEPDTLDPWFAQDDGSERQQRIVGPRVQGLGTLPRRNSPECGALPEPRVLRPGMPR